MPFQPSRCLLSRGELRREWVLSGEPLHHAALGDCPKRLCMCLGLEFVPRLSSSVPAGRLHSDLPSRQGWERGGVQLGREDLGAQTPRQCSSPAPHFTGGCSQRSGVSPAASFSRSRVQKGRRGTQEVRSGSRSSGEAEASSSRVSSLLRSTFSAEEMCSVCEPVTSLEARQLH